MPEQEEAYIVCCRRTDLDQWVEGATESNCCECDEIVMVSPSSWSLLRANNAKIICLHCVIKHPQFLKKGMQGLTAEQVTEVVNELKRRKDIKASGKS